LWIADNNGFGDGDGIPDQLEDDGDADTTESFVELWKNPAASDLNGDGLLNHSDHTTWRIQLCNLEEGLLPQPGSITGSQTVCEGSVTIYSIPVVPGATYYSWTLPAGWSGSSSSSSISATAGATGGIITVSAGNANGTGPIRSLSVTVIPVPIQTTISGVIVLNGQVNCYSSAQTITVAGSGTNFIVRNGGSATMIAGNRIDYLPGTKVHPGGHMHGYITTTGVCCGSGSFAPSTGPDQAAPCSPVRFPWQSEIPFFKIYPNPTSGKFCLEIQGETGHAELSLTVFNIRGAEVLTRVLSAKQKQQFSLSEEPAGIYFVRIVRGDKTEALKLVKIN
jgi:hypothetical protein